MRRFGKGFLIMAFSLLSVSGKVVLAADPVERAIIACENESTTFCSTVTPGQSRLMMCLGAHEDKISVDCAVGLRRGYGH